MITSFFCFVTRFRASHFWRTNMLVTFTTWKLNIHLKNWERIDKFFENLTLNGQFRSYYIKLFTYIRSQKPMVGYRGSSSASLTNLKNASKSDLYLKYLHFGKVVLVLYVENSISIQKMKLDKIFIAEKWKMKPIWKLPGNIWTRTTYSLKKAERNRLKKLMMPWMDGKWAAE